MGVITLPLSHAYFGLTTSVIVITTQIAVLNFALKKSPKDFKRELLGPLVLVLLLTLLTLLLGSGVEAGLFPLLYHQIISYLFLPLIFWVSIQEVLFIQKRI